MKSKFSLVPSLQSFAIPSYELWPLWPLILLPSRHILF